MSSQKVPPQSIDAERSVLGALMIDSAAVTRVVDVVEPDDFYRDSHSEIFKIVLQLFQNNEPSDLVTVADALKKKGILENVGGGAYLSELVDSVPTSANVAAYARIVRDKSILRKLIESSTDIVERGYQEQGNVDEFLDSAEQVIFNVAEKRIKKSFVSIKDVVKVSFKSIEKLHEQKGMLTGIATGYSEIDRLTCGLQPSDLIIVAGRPSMGKTSFAMNIVENAAIDHDMVCAVFSLEMSKEQLVQRMLCSRAEVDAGKLRGGFLAESDWPKLTRAAGLLSEAKIFIDDTPATNILEIRAKARRLQKREGLNLIVIDYLQLMRGLGRIESREREISEISRSLKAFAKELNVPVVALSQLNRGVEARQDKRPQLSDLRECVSGDTLVMLADGRRVCIESLVGTTPEVLAISENGKVVSSKSDKVWKVGKRQTFEITLASGRKLKATSKHKLFTGAGWNRLENIKVGERIAIARQIPQPKKCEDWSDERVILLAHLIGDGSYLTHQPIRYTTSSEDNSEIVKKSAESEFKVKVQRYESGKSWHQLVISGNGNRWHPAGVNLWLKELGIFNQRSYEKEVPKQIFQLSNKQIALFLKHLWATDGTISPRKVNQKGSHAIHYSTNSSKLAFDVMALLLRLGIVARKQKVQKSSYRPNYMIHVSGSNSQKKFLETVGAFGPKILGAEKLNALLDDIDENTNVDTLPQEIFFKVKQIMVMAGISHRAMAAMRGTSYGGSAHFKFSPSRDVVREYADLLCSEELYQHATSDIFWDSVISIKESGEEDVYDLTVPGPASWLADGVVSHNSGAIEQDADVIAFVYRDEMYNPESLDAGKAEVIISKQRNGPTGKVVLAFRKQFTKFDELARIPSGPMQGF